MDNLQGTSVGIVLGTLSTQGYFFSSKELLEVRSFLVSNAGAVAPVNEELFEGNGKFPFANDLRAAACRPCNSYISCNT